MIARIKNVFNQWQSDRQQLRELLIKLETLTDTKFLDRATTKFNIVEHMVNKMATDLRNYKG